MKGLISFSVFAAGISLGFCTQLPAAAWPSADESSCSANHFNSDGQAGYAETRDRRLPAASEEFINPGMNGSIRVHGWANSDVQVKACIQTAAPTDADAKALAQQVTAADGAGRIEAHGPTTHNHSWWSVSYEIWLPNASNLNMEASNGSITVDGVHGQLHFKSLNGSVKLSDVGGAVDGATTNGSVTLDLMGSGWRGDGLSVHTTNGSVRLNLPENFSANVAASTVNGTLRTDFPVTVSGEIRKNMSFVIGSGGPKVEAHTVNGSVHISRRS